MACDLMDGRDAFLTLCRDKHLEFSSLRRSKWSSMCMLVELHSQSQDRFVYTCNECKHHVETRYHCTVCEVSTDIIHSILIIGLINILNVPVCFFFFFHFRTMTCASLATILKVTCTRWTSWDSDWTMTATTKLLRPPKARETPAASVSSAASSRWCTRASVATPTARCRPARR